MISNPEISLAFPLSTEVVLRIVADGWFDRNNRWHQPVYDLFIGNTGFQICNDITRPENEADHHFAPNGELGEKLSTFLQNSRIYCLGLDGFIRWWKSFPFEEKKMTPIQVLKGTTNIRMAQFRSHLLGPDIYQTLTRYDSGDNEVQEKYAIQVEVLAGDEERLERIYKLGQDALKKNYQMTKNVPKENLY